MQILNYQRKLSGPLLDRIDMTVNVTRIPNRQLLNPSLMSSKQHISAQNAIANAISKQFDRYDSNNKYNSSLTSRDVKKHIPLTPDVHNMLTTAADKLGLSPRSYFKVLKVAQTIADIDDAPRVTVQHLAEALQYRHTS